VIEAAEQVRACVCVCGAKKEEGLLPVFSAERKAEATHAERKKETKKHFSIAAITWFPVPRTPALLHLHSLPQPPVPAARTDPAPLHRIACVSPGFPAGGGFSDRRTSPAFPTRSRYGHFPFVVRRGFLLRVNGGAGAGPMWWWGCIALDETIDRVRVLAHERGGDSLPSSLFVSVLLCSALAPRPQIAGHGNGIWVNCVGHMHDASYSCPLIS
jgi:hypothetical protein